MKKIQDKKEVEVLSQYNCTAAGHSTAYEGWFDNCLADCTAYSYPSYYASTQY